MLFSTLLKLQLQMLLVTGSYSVAAASISHPGSIGGCKDATLVTKSTYPFNGVDIAHSTYHCASGADRLLQEDPFQNENDTPAQSTCDSPCNIQCSHKEGILPPIADDCMVILDAFLIFPHTDFNNTQESIILDADTKQVLAFETCEVFIENYGNLPLEFCYSSLIGHVLDAASNCFPPVQPFYPEGVCVSADSSWRIGVSHS